MTDEDTWRKMLIEEMKDYGESLSDIVSSTMTEAEMDEPFDSGYGFTEGIPFTVWTERRVYFPLYYDGAEWVGSVSRHPDGEPTEHQGGG